MKGVTILAVLAVLVAAAAGHGGRWCPLITWKEHLLEHARCDKYYRCSFGRRIEKDCAEGLLFNTKKWACDLPENTDCGKRIRPEIPVESIENEKNCPADWTVERLIEHRECDKFFKCSNGELVEFSCPANLWFNVEKDVCDWPADTECGKRLKPEPKPEPEPEWRGESNEVEVEIEENKKIEFLPNGCPVDGHIYWQLPHRNKCDQFYVCAWGKKTLKRCPKKLHFNRRQQVCDYPKNARCNRW